MKYQCKLCKVKNNESFISDITGKTMKICNECRDKTLKVRFPERFIHVDCPNKCPLDYPCLRCKSPNDDDYDDYVSSYKFLHK